MIENINCFYALKSLFGDNALLPGTRLLNREERKDSLSFCGLEMFMATFYVGATDLKARTEIDAFRNNTKVLRYNFC